MAKSLDQILQELDAGYNPQRQSIQTRIDALPAQADAEIAGLKATQDQAFQDILGGARDRGMGFSGFVPAEQARYTGSQFLPAVARVRQSQNESRQSLFDALNNVNVDQRKYAMGIQQQELDRDASAKAAAFNPFAGLGAGGGAAQPTAKMQQRGDKGFNFQGPDGRPVSAAQYSQLTGVPFRKLLQDMAAAGDAGAKQALGFVGDDYGINAPKVGGNAQTAKLLNDLLWGVNSYKNPLQLGGVQVLSGSGIQSSGNGLRVL